MALGTYAELQTAVANWLDRSDFAARVPDFIALAEAELSRRLRVPEMEARATIAVAAGSERVTLPPDFRSARHVNITTPHRRTLEQYDLAGLQSAFGGGTGETLYYALADGQLWFGPKPDGAVTLEIVYRRTIPALSTTNTTNWLLTAHPDLYLMASVAQAELYNWTDDRLPLIKARVDEIIEQINLEGRKKNMGGGLRIRPGFVV